MAAKQLTISKALSLLHEPDSYLFADMPGGRSWTIVVDNGRRHGGYLAYGDAMRLLAHPCIKPQTDGMFGSSQTFVLQLPGSGAA